MYPLFLILIFLLIGNNTAFSAVPAKKRKPRRNSKSKSSSSSLPFALQKCVTPAEVLRTVASQLSPSNDAKGNVAGLILVRLSKQFMSLQNEYLYPSSSATTTKSNQVPNIPWNDHVKNELLQFKDATSKIQQVIDTLARADASDETLVEGTKATAVLSRLIPEVVTLESCQPLLQSWKTRKDDNADDLEIHQLSGLQCAYACFQQTFENEEIQLPNHIQQQYDDCNLPFCFLPGYLAKIPDLTVNNLVEEVPFQIDAIRTTSTKQVVAERRETAWLGDEGVAPFSYSGKSMPRYSWTPLVEACRDTLAQGEEHPYKYDGCLLNHYPDGGSAMRYHMDPDQGELWDFHTVVVSVGASRRVAFRSIPGDTNNDKKPHTFVAMHGDVMVMVDDCQSRFQHTVKPADNKQERAARASLVFKQTLAQMRQ